MSLSMWSPRRQSVLARRESPPPPCHTGRVTTRDHQVALRREGGTRKTVGVNPRHRGRWFHAHGPSIPQPNDVSPGAPRAVPESQSRDLPAGGSPGRDEDAFSGGYHPGGLAGAFCDTWLVPAPLGQGFHGEEGHLGGSLTRSAASGVAARSSHALRGSSHSSLGPRSDLVVFRAGQQHGENLSFFARVRSVLAVSAGVATSGGTV